MAGLCVWLRGVHGDEIRYNVPDIESYLGWSVRGGSGYDLRLTLDEIALLDALFHRVVYWNRTAPGVGHTEVWVRALFDTRGRPWPTEMRRFDDGRILYRDLGGDWYWVIPPPARPPTPGPLVSPDPPPSPAPPE